MTLSPPPAPIPEAVEPAAPKHKLAVLEAEHELAKAQPEAKCMCFIFFINALTSHDHLQLTAVPQNLV